MTEHFPLMVPGATVAAPRYEVRAPFDGTPIATVEMAGAEAVEQALATAYALFRDRDAWLPPARRIAILHKTARLMEDTAGRRR